MGVPLGDYVVFSAILFAVGVVGAVMRRNVLIVLMSVELMLNAANLVLIAFARAHHDPKGHAFAMVVMAIAAAEAAVGLAIAVGIFRSRRSINVDELQIMKH